MTFTKNDQYCDTHTTTTLSIHKSEQENRKHMAKSKTPLAPSSLWCFKEPVQINYKKTDFVMKQAWKSTFSWHSLKNVFHSFHGTGLSLLSLKCTRKSKQVKLVYTTGKLPTNCNCYVSLSNAYGKFISYNLISFILFNTSILFLFWLFLPVWRMHDLLLSYLICFGYCFLCIVVVYAPNVYLIEVIKL